MLLPPDPATVLEPCTDATVRHAWDLTRTPSYVAVVPSDYGSPAYVLVDASAEGLDLAVVRTPTSSSERVAHLPRRGPQTTHATRRGP